MKILQLKTLAPVNKRSKNKRTVMFPITNALAIIRNPILWPTPAA